MEDVPVVPLKSVALETDSLLVGHKIIAAVDSCLIVPTWRYKTLYDIYKVKGDSLLLQRHFLGAGEGPFEMTMANEAYNAENKTLLACDLNVRKSLLIDVSAIGRIDSLCYWKPCNVFKSATKSYSRFVYETDSTVIATLNEEGVRAFLHVLT